MDASVKSIDAETAADVAAAITITSQISQNRSIVIQTYMPRDADLGEFHDVMDKLSATIDRQRAKMDLEDLQANLAQEQKTLKQLGEDFVEIEPRAEAAWNSGNRKGPFKLSQQEVAQKNNARTNIERFREAIAKRNVEIAKCEAVIAKRD